MTLKRYPNQELLDFLERKWYEDFGLDAIVDVYGTNMTRQQVLEEMRKNTRVGVNYYNELFSGGQLDKYGEEWLQYRKQQDLL